jgi:hypothetical protein
MLGLWMQLCDHVHEHVCMCMCVCVCLFVISLLHIYIYIYMCVYVYVGVCVYVYLLIGHSKIIPFSTLLRLIAPFAALLPRHRLCYKAKHRTVLLERDLLSVLLNVCLFDSTSERSRLCALRVFEFLFGDQVQGIERGLGESHRLRRLSQPHFVGPLLLDRLLAQSSVCVHQDWWFFCMLSYPGLHLCVCVCVCM